MPAGVSWGQYIKFMTCALLSMIAGSQLVHMYYKPLQDINHYIKEEMNEVKATQPCSLDGKPKVK